MEAEAAEPRGQEEGAPDILPAGPRALGTPSHLPRVTGGRWQPQTAGTFGMSKWGCGPCSCRGRAHLFLPAGGWGMGRAQGHPFPLICGGDRLPHPEGVGRKQVSCPGSSLVPSLFWVKVSVGSVGRGPVRAGQGGPEPVSTSLRMPALCPAPGGHCRGSRAICPCL